MFRNPFVWVGRISENTMYFFGWIFLSDRYYIAADGILKWIKSRIRSTIVLSRVVEALKQIFGRVFVIHQVTLKINMQNFEKNICSSWYHLLIENKTKQKLALQEKNGSSSKIEMVWFCINLFEMIFQGDLFID